MKTTGICPKCKSDDILGSVRVLDRGYYHSEDDLSVAVYRNPTAMIFKGRLETTVHAWICVACGYTELYTHEADILARYLRKSN